MPIYKLKACGLEMHVCVCDECRAKAPPIYSYSVDKYVTQGDHYFNEAQYTSAGHSYERALKILNHVGGCSLCKRNIQKAIDLC